MKELQRKIKNLENKLNHENARIIYDSYLLKKSLYSNLLVILEIGGGFMVGYLLTRRKNKMALLSTLFSWFLTTKKIQSNIHSLSRIIKR